MSDRKTHPNAKAAVCEDPLRKADLVEGIDRFIWKCAYSYAQRYRADVDDLVQVGRVAAWRAAALYDETRGVSFLGYSSRWVQRRMLEEAKQQQNIVALPRWCLFQHQMLTISLDAPLPGDGEDGTPLHELMPCEGADALDYACLSQHVTMLRVEMERLDKRLRFVLQARFVEGRTLEQVGDALGLTRERVRQLQVRGLRLLRRAFERTDVRIKPRSA